MTSAGRQQQEVQAAAEACAERAPRSAERRRPPPPPAELAGRGAPRAAPAADQGAEAEHAAEMRQRAEDLWRRLQVGGRPPGLAGSFPP